MEAEIRGTLTKKGRPPSYHVLTGASAALPHGARLAVCPGSAQRRLACPETG